MKIQSIKSTYNPTNRGVYFTKTANVFERNQTVTEGIIDYTSKGISYIKDTDIPPEFAAKIKEIPFIKAMSDGKDVFIHFVEHPRIPNDSIFKDYFSTAKIIIADYTKPFADVLYAGGSGKSSQREATEKLLENIEQKKFSSDIPSLQKIFI